MAAKSVREVALETLVQIEKSQAYSNLLLNQKIKQANLEPRDIGLLTELVYGTVQRQKTLDYYIASFVAKGKRKLEDWVRILLRLSVYQLVYLDKVPPHAIIHEAVNIAKKRGHKGISGLVNGVLRSMQRQGMPPFAAIEDKVKRLAVEYSYPEWLVKRWIDQYGEEETVSICEEMLLPPKVTARVNVRKRTVEEALERLEHEGVQAKNGVLSDDAIVVDKGTITSTRLFQDGELTIQDESSMLVARAVAPRPGERILDACAAPGGKSTHMAERMDGEGTIVSLDMHRHKVKLIEEQAKRLGLDNIKAQTLDARKAREVFADEPFDRILVDAPCSGLGVIRRKPDIKWTKREADMKAIRNVQLDILSSVANLVKPGGLLIYSTCTIDQLENEQVIAEFMEAHGEFSIDDTVLDRLPAAVQATCNIRGGMVTILPHHFGTDGFFITCLKKGT
ncbi:16S rRNA (cytosine(967)-C(5))-methyltransferase RsmB [Halalkalibacterium halodurans]|uniref:16S rRNA (cytosine(967)-C(5))-methyltransferase RsmB n=1 Tax=Halalkalibacterium halodurans TaxID=86665 RepID=UPI001067B0DB|nr:16S rRNA (cytosine(967)-C(5))-methyltransferase RsmB [Halalkalibacterium halodurans]MDY7223053.1 16S rRNA (cytosine(967)-C(5))-methyltransferase RsmB [Halalkalibacterium halodurans]MDY7242274.1 16S rRNA (cytosine(967)-C(5))-methyltransferase RsmB [Halalkalibacterium halodurans]TES54523.1 16S rRNA (cytosine(967)-C(5))-methyltransferase RsmB [Halalkalibacterium halodurans]